MAWNSAAACKLSSDVSEEEDSFRSMLLRSTGGPPGVTYCSAFSSSSIFDAGEVFGRGTTWSRARVGPVMWKYVCWVCKVALSIPEYFRLCVCTTKTTTPPLLNRLGEST